MKKFKIEKGIPVQPHRSILRKYPFADCKVGESFRVVPVPKQTLGHLGRALRACAYRFQSESREYEAWRFVVRSIQGERAVRVWRIK